MKLFLLSCFAIVAIAPCGDGIIDVGEECDDGDTDDTNG